MSTLGFQRREGRVRVGGRARKSSKERLASVLELPERRNPRVSLGMKQGYIFKERRRFSAVCSSLL